MTIQTHPNIALIKYWGKRDETLFLPTKSSISITLPHLTTTTTIAIAQDGTDRVIIGDKIGDEKVVLFLDYFRKLHGVSDHFLIESKNSFPTAAGIASSASGFAALAMGLDKLYKLGLSPKELSQLARRGSGSACRSMYPRFAIWHKGEKADGSDSYAEPLFSANHWPELRVIVAVVNRDKKTISSRVAMQQTVATSPRYEQWVADSQKRVPVMIEAIKQKDIHAVGRLAEQDCLEMHECIRTTTPSIEYWQPETHQIIELMRSLRKQGIACYFTIDAGPNVKIITLEKHVQQLLPKLGQFAILLL